MAVALRENRVIRGVEAIAERPDGTRFRFTPYPTPIHDALGAVKSGINLLVIAKRESIGRLRSAFGQAPDKNAAGIPRLVGAILSETRQHAGGARAAKGLLQAIQRIATLSAARGLFPTDAVPIESWDLLSNICMIARSEVSESVELLCESAAGNLPGETALPLALIAKELISNAARHGLNGQPKLLVRVGLSNEFGSYVFTVEDNGPGYTLPANSTSFGLGLVTALAQLLNGTFEVWRNPGAYCIIRFPDPRMLN